MADRRHGAWVWLAIACLGTVGAKAGDAAEVVAEPAAIRLDGADARQQVAVSGRFEDGAIRDVSGEARFAVEPAGIAAVSTSGVVTPKADGRATLKIEALGRSIDVPIEVVHAGDTRPVSYRHDVAAVLSKAGCNMGACHGNFNGKGGFRLSLRGDDPEYDLAALTRDAFGRRVDTADPGRSLIVLKPTGQVPHEGGRRFAIDSPEARTFLAWLADRCRDDKSEAPKLTRLVVFPAERMLASPSRSQQLVVTAEFADGSRRDVTRQSSFDVNDPTRAAVTAEGKVVVKGPVEVVVAVRYLGGRGVSRLAFLADRPDFAWKDPTPNNAIDVHVFAKLKALKVNPSDPASDAVFLRRAYLDAIGLLPTADEARAFLDDTDPEKRSKLVDRLVARPEFADFWALKWADLLRNEEKTMGLKGVWVFQRWLRDQIARDVPLDEFARRIITAKGSTWTNPPASFYRTNRDPATAAETVGQVFLGVRLQCARCHNHPFDVWTQDDYYGLAAYFGNVARKEVNNTRKDNLDKHEINGDEVVYLSADPPRVVQPRTGSMMEPKPPAGPRPSLGDDPDALDDLADWLTRHNDQFARNVANRVWFHLIGRGVVEPVDDFRDSNPPSNPALLDALTAELVAHGMRLRPLVAFVMKSRAYALSSRPDPTNADDEANFARAAIRLLPAEVLLDAIGRALDRPEDFRGAPRGLRAAQLPGARMGGEFLKVFGKPDRLLTCECERSEATTLAQAFQLINGDAVRDRLTDPANRLGRLLDNGDDDASILDEFYLATLSRRPGAAERAAALAFVAKGADRRKAWEDVAWAIMNTKEFLLRH
ncbi:MAG TPA: DUF1549 and DUF1553 domain-containing protein [Isosphaeraceae bacterium]|jgi:hypothetical protein|nr:DUF1549 and DUF1553 domain-containing protein [Isosphaeraceae bacterium]